MVALKIGKALAGAALALAATSAAAVSFNISNDFQGWLDSVGSNPTLGTGTFIAGPALSGLPGVSFAVTDGGVALNGSNLTTSLQQNGYIEWTFASPQNGWGGTFSLTGDNDTGLLFQANALAGGFVDVQSIGANQSLSGFYGFSSADTFTAVRVVGTGTFTSYNMSDVSVAAVPEPGEWAMMLAGLALLGFVAKRRKAA